MLKSIMQMRRAAMWAILFHGLFSPAAGQAAPLKTPRVKQAGLERGIALGLFAEDPGWSYRPLLQEIARLGADHVELAVAWYQTDAESSEVYEHPRLSAPEPTIRAAVRAARGLGLAVLLVPVLRLEAPADGDWRGTLRPLDRARWFASYGELLEELARLANAEGVEALGIGSELSSLDGDAEPWRPLVASVRQLFGGRLVYAGNWDHYPEVAVYDLVDQIGLSGYFALAEPRDAVRRPIGVEELELRWLAVRGSLETFARAHGRPLLLTEVGYLSQLGAAAWPWAEGTHRPVDLDEQRRCYEAFRRAWQDAPSWLLAGAYFWNWYGYGGPSSRGYTPRGKPAAEEIRRFFSQR
jgi:hypothetical protein